MLEIYVTVTPMVVDYTSYVASFYEEGKKTPSYVNDSRESMDDLLIKVKKTLIHKMGNPDYRMIGDFDESDLDESDLIAWGTPIKDIKAGDKA